MISTPAIVLHTTPYGESSVIVKAFTRLLGVRSYIIKGNLYLMYGTDKTEHDIYVVDLNTFNYKHYEFSQFLSAEPEGLAPYKGYLMVNTNFPGGIYRLMKY